MTRRKIAYHLRDVPPDVWDALIATCDREQLPLRTVVLRALCQYLHLPAIVDQPAPQRRLRTRNTR